MLPATRLLALVPSLLVVVNAAPSVLPSYNTWTSAGCYEDQVSARVLPHPVATNGGPSSMTVELCLDACFAAGYSVAGVEWSQECFCGYDIPSTLATDGRCNMECKGNANELCGGSNGLNVYQNSGPTSPPSYNGWTYSDCYVDSVWSRVLPEYRGVSGPLTVEKCLDTCSAGGFEFAGVEYANECFCGRTAPTVVATDGRCRMPCQGNPSEVCGGANGINVYSHSAPTNLQPYKSWTYSNCYVDSINDRVLPKTIPQNGALTIESCLDACDAEGYAFAGVEYGRECYCGRSLPTNVATDGRCNMSCQGNAGEICGGQNGLSVYQSSNGNNQPHNLDTFEKWTYSGCYVDSINSRVLPVRAAIEQDPDMTIELCLGACKYLGFKYAGLEYHQECWCGDVQPPQLAPDDRCDMTCNGNSLEICGGQNGISVYEFCPPVPTTITTTTGVVTEYTTDRTIATEYTDTYTSGGVVVGTTTVTAPTTITTTIAIPITATTTVIGDVTLTTSLPTALTGSTTIVVPLTASTTSAVTLTGPTTIPVPFTAVTTVVGPSTFTSTRLVPSTGTATVPITVVRTSFTLSVFTGTTSFVDRLTTVIQPVIILTTLARTFTTTTGSPSPFTTSLPSATVVTTSVATGLPVTLTTFTTTPFTTTSSAILTFPTSSLEIDPVVTTSFFGAPVTSPTTGFAEFTTTSSSVAEVPTATVFVSEYTTTTVGYIPYTTTAYNAEPTTVTTTYASPITVTTTITTPCCEGSQTTTAPPRGPQTSAPVN